MIRKALFGFGLVALLLTLAIVPIIQANAQQQDRVRAEQFVQIADRARQHTVSIRDMAASKGANTAKMDGLIAEGDALLKEARAFLADNKLADAISRATSAMRKYTEAIKSLGEALRPDAEEVEREDQEVAKRETERLERIKQSIRSVPNAPQSLVKAANERLAAAQVAVAKVREVKKPQPQKGDLKPVQMTPKTSEVLQAVKDIEAWKNNERINAYLKETEKRIQKLAEEIENTSKRGVNVEAIKKRLVELQRLLEVAKKKAATGDVNGTLKDVSEIQRLITLIQKELSTAIRASARPGGR